jgi:hypothetical protein
MSVIVSGFNQNWNMSTNVNKTPQYQIAWKFVQRFWSCYMRTDGQTNKHDEANKRIFDKFSFERSWNPNQRREDTIKMFIREINYEDENWKALGSCPIAGICGDSDEPWCFIARNVFNFPKYVKKLIILKQRRKRNDVISNASSLPWLRHFTLSLLFRQSEHIMGTLSFGKCPMAPVESIQRFRRKFFGRIYIRSVLVWCNTYIASTANWMLFFSKAAQGIENC